MALFIRHQLSPYCITVQRLAHYQGGDYWFEQVIPAMHTPAPTPHGRYDDLSIPDLIWGVDQYGYNDFDDYHLALYGA